MTKIACTNCHRVYPSSGVPYRCLTCGGIFDFIELPKFGELSDQDELSGIWKYRQTFNLHPESPLITLGEGHTKLVWKEISGRSVAFKLEYMNPTGSYKDRGAAVLVSFLKTREVSTVVEDSSGNAGAALAAYAAEAKIDVSLYVPDSTSKAKLDQIEKFGAKLVRILGPRSNATQAVMRAVDHGATYASHAYLPQVLSGYATIAYELYEQMGTAPGTVIAPAGQGNLILAIGRGFQALKNAGLIDSVPQLIGVQVLACAPMWAVFQYGGSGLGWVTEGDTLAEGVRIKHPVRGDVVIKTVRESGGQFVVVEEGDIMPGRDELASFGFNVEPTSAIVWNALNQVITQAPEPISVILTGAGFKAH
jgi:threonine synthase